MCLMRENFLTSHCCGPLKTAGPHAAAPIAADLIQAWTDHTQSTEPD